MTLRYSSIVCIILAAMLAGSCSPPGLLVTCYVQGLNPDLVALDVRVLLNGQPAKEGNFALTDHLSSFAIHVTSAVSIEGDLSLEVLARNSNDMVLLGASSITPIPLGVVSIEIPVNLKPLWTPVPSGTSGGLFAVWGSAPKNVWIVGSPNIVLRFNGTDWIASPETGDLFAVWGSDAANIWAVGNNKISRYNGTSWSDLSYPPPQQTFWGIWGSGKNDVWLVGTNSAASTILHYDGTTLSAQASNFSGITGSYATLQSAWGSGSSSSNIVWTVGNLGDPPKGTGGIVRCTNMACALIPVSSNPLYEIWGISQSDIWAVGSGGTILHFDGANWTLGSSGTTQDLYGVWGTQNDVWAVGNNGTMLHWNGTRWVAVFSGTTQRLNGIWGSGPRDIWAVGYGGTILHYQL